MATELGDIQASGMVLGVWSAASGGKVPEDILACERSRTRIDVQATAQLLQGVAICRLAHDRVEEAIAALEESKTIWQRAGVKNTYTLSTLCWLATAKRLAAEVTSVDASQPLQGETSRETLVDRQT